LQNYAKFSKNNLTNTAQLRRIRFERENKQSLTRRRCDAEEKKSKKGKESKEDQEGEEEQK